MDAIQLIRRDHRDVEQLLRGFERAEREGDLGRQSQIVRAAIRELSVHSAVEEELFYPALRRAGMEDQVLTALEEHHVVKLTLSELDRMSPRDARFGPKVRVLAENVRLHVGEEERDLLPRVRRALDARQLRELGDALTRAKEVAPTRPHPAAPDTPPGVFLAGGVAAVYDRARDALRAALEAMQAILEQWSQRGVDVVRNLAARAQEQGREAVEDARRRGRKAAAELRERSRRTLAETERRGRGAAQRAQQAGRTAARAAERRGRAVARGTGGDAHASR
jgi:hemerythrin HHE cation binding domain-containing protein